MVNPDYKIARVYYEIKELQDHVIKCFNEFDLTRSALKCRKYVLLLCIKFENRNSNDYLNILIINKTLEIIYHLSTRRAIIYFHFLHCFSKSINRYFHIIIVIFKISRYFKV